MTKKKIISLVILLVLVIAYLSLSFVTINYEGVISLFIIIGMCVILSINVKKKK